MCDTLCVLGSGHTYFAKNSDRPIGEIQVVHAFARRSPSRNPLRTQYLDLGVDPGAFAFIGSQPTWLWGVEHGVNEHGVAIGNEKIWTVQNPRGAPAALLGMDIVRLGLERAASADEALEIMTALLEQFGQGGTGEPDHDEPYYSSFLIADSSTGWMLETNDHDWAARKIATPGGAIGNRVSLDTNWDRCSLDVAGADERFDVQSWRAPKIPTGIADHRLGATSACVATATTPSDIVATLRHHGTRPWGAPFGLDQHPQPIPEAPRDDWSGVSVCMHVRDYQTTTASMVCEISSRPTARPASGPTIRLWICLGSPCVGVFVPTVAPHVPGLVSDPTIWTRFDALRVRAESSPDSAAQIRGVWAPIESQLWTTADDQWASAPHDAPSSDAEIRAILEDGFRQLRV